MVDSGFDEGELNIDWDHLLDSLPDDLNFDFCDLPIVDGFSTSPNSAGSFSIDDIEQFLMDDDEPKSSQSEEGNDQSIVAADVLLLSDALLDSSRVLGSDRSKDSSSSPESAVDVETEEEEKEKDKPHESGVDVPHTKEGSVVDVLDDDDDDDDDDGSDPLAKKRKMQMRNRDAAVRSRERKKMYVRDLEMKSKYYEAECKRLGIVLQCCLAENQALRLSLHNSKAFDASMTKQESAVLLLEIPAAGFPAWVNGHHIPANSAQPPPLNPGARSSGKRRQRRVGKPGGSEKDRKQDS
ncbi:hypothetical protein OROHE_001848 [Orobanche hederae]